MILVKPFKYHRIPSIKHDLCSVSAYVLQAQTGFLYRIFERFFAWSNGLETDRPGLLGADAQHSQGIDKIVPGCFFLHTFVKLPPFGITGVNFTAFHLNR